MSKYKINSQKEFMSLAKLIKPNKSYNVSIQEAEVRNSGFTDRQLEQLATLLDPIKQDITEIKNRLKRIEDTPTMKKELGVSE